MIVGDLLIPLNPFAASEYRNLLLSMGPLLSAERARKQADGGSPSALWLEPGGLLPWATTENGGTLYWLTGHHPDHWTVVVRRDRSAEYERFDGSMIAFVLGYLNRALEPRLRLSHPDDEIVATITPLR